MLTCFDAAFDALPKAQQSALLDELRRIARRYINQERPGHTLQATELVNEAYASLAGKQIEVENRKHFIAIAARQMRRLLVNYARKKLTEKRSSKPVTLTISDIASDSNVNTVELIYIDKLLDDLNTIDNRGALAFELKIFSSLTNPEIANVMGMSLATTERDIKAARAWLKTELSSVND